MKAFSSLLPAARPVVGPLLIATAVVAAPVRAADAVPAASPALATTPVAPLGTTRAGAYEGQVQAVRQAVVAAQVAGEVLELPVQAGQHVRAGQVLARLDARAAEQQAGAASAQVLAARAAQEAATKEFERQKTLFQKNYISQAALDQAEARFKAAQAEAAAQLAAAQAARSQTGWYQLAAPFGGVVAEVSVVRGDLALPGRPLVTMYDPSALRVSARVPQSVASGLAAGAALGVEIAGQPALSSTRWELLPAVDPSSHTQELRVGLPATAAALPGTFARVVLPGASVAAGTAARVSVPEAVVVRRAELTAVYVVGADGRALLRQVRLGPAEGGRVEVLSGLSAGERVALDPQAAARAR